MQDRDTPLRVGSVKAISGISKLVAGSASLIKMALAIHKKQYPPSANFVKMKEGIEVQNILVQTETEPWKNTTIRRAGVSAFGFGGTNFHVVLEEPVTKIQTVRTFNNPNLQLQPKNLRHYIEHFWKISIVLSLITTMLSRQNHLVQKLPKHSFL